MEPVPVFGNPPMFSRYRIPITAITVFGTSSLLALSIAIVLYLGFNQAAESTRELWADKAKTRIDAMEESLDDRLQPIHDQASWVARDVTDLSDPAALDGYFFGALSATPQVSGVAVISVDGRGRRWNRRQRVGIDEDWSQQPWFRDYIELVKSADAPNWREPVFTESVSAATLLHDVPLHDPNGKFIGIFAQIVAVRELSAFISRVYSDTGITPFVLYNRDYVLAHPLIGAGSEQQPLAHLDDLGDLVLQRIWTPDKGVDFMSRTLTNTETGGVSWGEHFYLYLYREITQFGPAPWTIGVYLNTTLQTERPMRDLMQALAAGLAVLVFAIVIAIVIGRKVSGPIKAIARAADAVDAGHLDSIENLGASRIRELDEAGSAFNNMVASLRERQLIRETLGRFVPEKVASALLSGGGDIPVQRGEATILFCDIEAFTRLTEVLGPVKIVALLNAYFSAMVDILERHGGVVTQFQGDAILATFNVPVTDSRHAANALQAACEMLDAVAENRYAGETIRIRIGINTGDVIAGAIGAKGRLNYTVHGDAVNLAARLEALNKEYGSRLLLSESTAAKIKEDRLIQVGETSVRGQTRSIRFFSLEPYFANPETGTSHE